MRPNNPVTIHHVGTNDGETRLQLDATATAHLIGVLTDIASDPIAYAIREYSTNARDSHIESGNSGPIWVTLPSTAKPTFSVEDFGLGLSVDELRDVYTLYGRSTKRDSDDVNGVLGLGCKSGLTYNDSFDITAVKNGVKTFATIAKDSDGVGTLRVIDTVSTTDPNGVRIDIPVKSFDVQRFHAKAADFYRYWPKGSVLVNGAEPETIWDDDSLIWIDEDVAVSKGRHSSVVVQHDVAYPIDYGHFDADFSVVAFVPTGSVNFTPNREALHYTSRTNETLAILAQYAKERLVRTIQAKVDAAATPFERLQIVNQWRSELPVLAKDFYRVHGTHVKLPHATWRYNRNAYHHKAAKITSISWNDLLGEQVLVTDYPNKGLSQLNRARLDEFFGELRETIPFNTPIYLIPSCTPLEAIRGRSRIFSWSTIEAATEHVKVSRSYTGGSKKQTEYEVRLNGSTHSVTAKELAELVEEEGCEVAYEYDYGHYAGKVAGVAVAVIKSRQGDKFRRLFPQARDAYVVWSEQLKAAEEALTADDRLKGSITNLGALSPLRDHVEKLLDPALRRILELANADESVTLKAYLLRGGHIEPNRDAVAAVFKPYPLLSHLSPYNVQNTIEDTVLYINSKYNTINPAKEQS